MSGNDKHSWSDFYAEERDRAIREYNEKFSQQLIEFPHVVFTDYLIPDAKSILHSSFFTTRLKQHDDLVLNTLDHLAPSLQGRYLALPPASLGKKDYCYSVMFSDAEDAILFKLSLPHSI